MWIWRLFKLFVVLAILIVLFIGFGLPMLANTEKGREQMAGVLGKALNRNVAIGGLDVGWFFSSVDVADLRIDNPEGFPEGAFLKAGMLEFDSQLSKLFEGQVQGGLRGRGLEVHIIRQGGRTNLDGLGGAKKEEKKEPSGDAPDLDLSLELLDSRLTVEDLDKGDKLVLDGVGLEMRLTNKAGAQSAGLKIRVRAIDRDTLSVRDLEIEARQAGDWLELEKLTALLPGQGSLTGSGRLQVRGGDSWNVKLNANGVGLDEDLMPVAAALFPFASAAGGQVAGNLNAAFDLKGRGLTWEAMKPTLDGTGTVALSGLRLPQDSLLAQAAMLAGRGEGAISLNDAGAQFGVGNGWISFNRLSASGNEVRYDLAGRVSLDGRLDLRMDLMPLVKAFGGGKRYDKVSGYVKEIPLRISGTTAVPEMKPPKAEDLLKGLDIEKGIGKALEKLGER